MLHSYNRYTLTMVTGSDSKLEAYMKVISCYEFNFYYIPINDTSFELPVF